MVIMYTSGTSAKPKGLAHQAGTNVSETRPPSLSASRNRSGFAVLSDAFNGHMPWAALYNLLFLPFLCGASVVIDHVSDARLESAFSGTRLAIQPS